MRNEIVAHIVLERGKIRTGRPICEKLPRVKKDIGPLALRGRRRISGMRNIPGDKCDITRTKMKFLAIIEFKRATAGMTDADFQTIMKVEMIAGNIRNFPLFPAQQKNGKFEG